MTSPERSCRRLLNHTGTVSLFMSNVMGEFYDASRAVCSHTFGLCLGWYTFSGRSLMYFFSPEVAIICVWKSHNVFYWCTGGVLDHQFEIKTRCDVKIKLWRRAALWACRNPCRQEMPLCLYDINDRTFDWLCLSLDLWSCVIVHQHDAVHSGIVSLQTYQSPGIG